MSQVRSERLAARAAPRRAASEAAAVPALRLVDDSALPRRRALTRAATALASLLAAAGLFGVVCLHVLLAQGQVDLDALHARDDAATAANGKLTVEVAQLEAPARVVGWAQAHLGMVPLAAITYLPVADPASLLPPVPARPLPTAAASATPATGTPAATPAKTKPATSGSATSGSATSSPVTKAPSTTVAARRP